MKHKIFVLDTSVILYDHRAVQQFKEHDVAIPIQVLEELDNMKSGNETRNIEARHFIQLIDSISKKKLLNQWNKIGEKEQGRFKIVLAPGDLEKDATVIFADQKFDHHILNASLHLQKKYPEHKIILVSKDICLRLKAQALNIHAEDYETGKIKNLEKLNTGYSILDSDDMQQFALLKKDGSLPWEKNRIRLPHGPVNHFYIFKHKRKLIHTFFNLQEKRFQVIDQSPVFNIRPRNTQQAMALHALLNPAVRLVTLQGNAGTGKTLLALAAALQQRKDFRQIYVARPVIPLSNREIGYLPGDAKNKTNPYLAPIWDNIRFIKEQFNQDPTTQRKIEELIETEKIAVTPLAFIRGRTLSKIFFIIDEAQNLTPHEVKTIISRAGENTKIVFTGDIYQIDTPYLDAESNGLSYLIEQVQDHPLYAHVTLEKGERSELANLANTLL